MGRGFPGGKIKILPKRLNTIKEISWWHWPREGLGSLILGWITLASMGQPKFSLSWSAIVRLLFSRSRKEFGDSEPFGRWLLLDRVSVLTSLWTETNNRLQRKPVGSNSTPRASAISAETPSLAHQSSTGHEGGQREERAEGGAGRGRKCSGGWLQFIKKTQKNKKLNFRKHQALQTKPHRGEYGTGGGGGMYKSRIAGFSFLADLSAEPHGDWVLIREELFWRI